MRQTCPFCLLISEAITRYHIPYHILGEEIAEKDCYHCQTLLAAHFAERVARLYATHDLITLIEETEETIEEATAEGARLLEEIDLPEVHQAIHLTQNGLMTSWTALDQARRRDGWGATWPSSTLSG